MATPQSASTATAVAIALTVFAVLGAGAYGVALLSAHRPAALAQLRAGSMLLASMVGVIDTCVLADRGSTRLPADLQARCSGPEVSAVALMEYTLQDFEAPGAAPRPGRALPAAGATAAAV